MVELYVDDKMRCVYMIIAVNPDQCFKNIDHKLKFSTNEIREFIG
jgi:hypothetical protein